MPVSTTTSTNTAGGSTTVAATVSDTGPGGQPRTIDVYMHVQSSKFTHGGTPINAYMADAQRLCIWWKDQLLPAGGQLIFSYRLIPRAGVEFEGTTEATVTVCDRSASPLFLVNRFTVT
jgi:hypothetical protein